MAAVRRAYILQDAPSFVPLTRILTAGNGLTGGGDLTADRTFDVVANADGSIIANANDIQVGVLATDGQHGNRGGGALHANVVAAGAAGFMTGADKTKLDAYPGTPAQITMLDREMLGPAAVVLAGTTRATVGITSCLVLDNAATEGGYYYYKLPAEWDGGNITITIQIASNGTNGNVVRMEAAIDRHESGRDIDAAAAPGTPVTVDATMSATQGVSQFVTFTFDDAAEKDSAAAGDAIVIRIQRLGTHANDTNTNSTWLVDNPSIGFRRALG